MRFLTFDEILAREFQCGLDCFGAAANVENMTKTFWRVRNEIIGQILRDLRRKKAGMRVSELVELLVHRRQHVRMRVAETRYCRATGCIEVFLSGTVADHEPPGSTCDGIRMTDLAMKNVAHDCGS